MFLSFEGIDGAGKTTQVELLKTYLEDLGRTVVVAREPGGTAFGELIRKLLLEGPEISAGAEASLFAAARAELVDKVIKPAFAAGSDVILDRYVDSSLAYQGFGRGLDVEKVLEWNRCVIDDVFPDRTFVLTVPAEDVTRRLGRELTLFAGGGSKGPPDRMERESLEFRRSVEEAYRLLSRRYPERIVELDATLMPKKLASRIKSHVKPLLQQSRALPALTA